MEIVKEILKNNHFPLAFSYSFLSLIPTFPAMKMFYVRTVPFEAIIFLLLHKIIITKS